MHTQSNIKGITTLEQLDMPLITEVIELAKMISNEVLLPNFAKVVSRVKQDGSWLTIADTQAHKYLLESLPKLVDYPVLSEELTAIEQQQILDQQPLNYWCVDPLDGTSNFIQGIPYWCISIGLIENGELALAVVHDPCRDECFSSSSYSISQLNGKPLNNGNSFNSMLNDSMGLIDFKRLDKQKIVALAKNPPYRSQRSFGASALDLCWIAANRCQVYLHGKQKLWDHAAGLLILKNANGHAETFEGKSVFDNSLLPKSVIAASQSNLMNQWKNYFNSIN